MAIFTAAVDKNQNHSMLAIQGTAGTADTAGTAETIPVGADPTTGAMYVYDLAPAGSLSVGSISVTSIESVGTLNSGTITKLEGGTLGLVSSVGTVTGVGTVTNLGTMTNLGSVTNIGMLHGGTVVTTMGDLSGGTLDLVSSLAAGSIAVTAGTIDAFTADIPGGTTDLVTRVSTLGTLEVGTISAMPNIPGGTLGLVTTVSNLTAGSIAVTAGTIGTVTNLGTINTVIPGTAVTNLGKQYAQAAGSTDVGIAVFGKILSADSHDSNNNDGNYGRLSLTDFRELRTRDQRAIDLANCNVAADYTALSNDTTGIEVTYNHVFGTAALSFDKVNGTDNTIYGGVSKALGTINVGEIFEAGGFVGCSVYLPSLTNVVNVFLRIGTDSTNYNCWTWPVANLTAATWLNLRQPASTPDAARNAGNGWNPTALVYVAFGVEFSGETIALADILFDHVHIVGGRVTATDISTAVTTTVNNPNINVQKVGNSIVETSNGAVSAGVQRVTIANNSTGSLGTVGAIGQVHNAGTVAGGTIGLVTTLSNLTAGSVAVTAGTITAGTVKVTNGTIDAFTADIPGGTVDMLSAGTLSMLNAGTITTIPNIPGGTLALVTTVSNLSAGSVAVIAGTGVVTGGTIQMLNAGTVTRVEGGSIAVTAGTSVVTGGSIAVTAGTIGAFTADIPGGTIDLLTNLGGGTVQINPKPSKPIITYGTTIGGTAAVGATLLSAAGAGTAIYLNDISVTNLGTATSGLQYYVGFGTASTMGTSNVLSGVLTGNGGIQKSYPKPVGGHITNLALLGSVAAAGTVAVNLSYWVE